MEEEEKAGKKKMMKRLTLKQTEVIRKEFGKAEGERDAKTLDKIIKGLKFFKRFD